MGGNRLYRTCRDVDCRYRCVSEISDILFKLGDESVDSSRMIRLQDRKDGVLMNEHLEVNL